MEKDLSNVGWPGWQTVRLIGRGSFGAVYEIQRKTTGTHTEHAALKVISLPKSSEEIEELRLDGYTGQTLSLYFTDSLEKIETEYALMADMKGHANVVYCDDIRKIQQDNGFGWDIYIKMELLTPMKSYLSGNISPEQALEVGYDICNALTLCQKLSIVHRDIKPENIFVSRDGNYKIGDFGIAKTIEHATSGTRTGTFDFMAPEVYNNRPYDHQSDIYSLGMVMYWMLNERTGPFLRMDRKATPSEKEQARERRFAGEQIPAPAHGSKELIDIVLKACAFDPKERYQSAQEMLGALQALQGGQKHQRNSIQTEDDQNCNTRTGKNVTAMVDDQNAEDGTVGPDFSQATATRKPVNKRMLKLAGAAGALIILLGLLIWLLVSLLGNRQEIPGPGVIPQNGVTDQAGAEQATVLESGTCGDNLTWKMDEKGTLTISGTGIMTNYQSAAQVPWKKYTEEIKTVVIENGVAGIGGHAFYDCKNLTSVSIPDSVTDIRGISFCGCTSLTTVSLPAYLADMGGYVFSGCTSLSSIVIPEGMTTIPAYTFRDCTSLKEIQIPASVTEIRPEVFAGCEKLKRVGYGGSEEQWKKIKINEGNDALGNAKVAYESYTGNPQQMVIASGTCGEALNWTLNKQGTLIVSGTGDMTNYPGASEVPWRDYIRDIYVVIIRDGVTGIGGHAFYDCTNLASVHIPESVKDIRGFAFSDCENLTTMILPDSITQMGGYLFHNCVGLKHVELPEGLVTIPGHTFSGCTALESVVIPKGVKEIDGAVFQDCTALAKIYYSANEADWKKIKIGSNNAPLEKAQVVYIP